VNIFEVQGIVLWVVVGALVLMKGFAFVSALRYPAEAYLATGKLTKQTWCAITGLALAAQLILFTPFNLIGIAFTVAALVFLADVLPALRTVARPSR